ncbi:MAG: hypothetical protein BV458_07520 [Thermoplasmata archaeon M9B2D]|nr:MAG: hypothetical protein BV458_07520 [Thermoplasmata archaeon M9B2D]
MRTVGVVQDISIQAPDDAYFSYFNSPYVGHSLGTAIDIYPRHQEWGGPVLSPVSGKVVKIRKMQMGKEKQFPTEDYDYGIAILPEHATKDAVRVMHCRPIVQEGDKLDLGDQIGCAIRSRYFNYWTGPHYHVEIMPLDSFMRSTKSYTLDIPMSKEQHHAGKNESRMEFLITHVNDDRAIGFSNDCSYSSIGDLVGLSANDEDSIAIGIIDGGLSHYQHGGVLGSKNTTEGGLVIVGGLPVGCIASKRDGVSYFKRGPSIMALLDGIVLRGLSCFVYPHHYTRKGIPQLILIPREYRGFRNLIENDSLGVLEIRSLGDTNKF